jgi:WD40 repeat protein
MKFLAAAFALLGVMGTGQQPKPTLDIEAHAKTVLSLAFSQDGRWLASGSVDNHARVFDVSTGDELHDFDTHYAVTGISFTPDKSVLASVGWGGQLWDLKKDIRLHHYESHTGFATCAELTPDGAYLVSGSQDAHVKICDVKSRTELRGMQHGEPINCLKVARDGRSVAVGSDRFVKIYAVPSGELLKTIRTRAVMAVAFSPDGRKVVTAHTDKFVRTWDAADTGFLKEDSQHTDRALSVAWSPDGKLIASVGSDRRVIIRDAATFEVLRKFKAHDAEIYVVSFSPDSRLLATGAMDGRVRLWTMEPGS